MSTHIRDRLREHAAILRENHPDDIEEPYPGAGYCGCYVCQHLAPLLEDAARRTDALEKRLATANRSMFIDRPAADPRTYPAPSVGWARRLWAWLRRERWT